MVIAKNVVGPKSAPIQSAPYHFSWGEPIEQMIGEVMKSKLCSDCIFYEGCPLSKWDVILSDWVAREEDCWESNTSN
jgi:hypothetical protein